MQKLTSGRLRVMRGLAKAFRARRMQQGGYVDEPTLTMLGEHGPEAVLPVRGTQFGTLQPAIERMRKADPNMRQMSSAGDFYAGPAPRIAAMTHPMPETNTETATKVLGAARTANPVAGMAFGVADTLSDAYSGDEAALAKHGARWASTALGAAESKTGQRTALRMGTAAARFLPSFFARGGIIRKPTLAIVGESGPEVIVPLKKRRKY